jgi:hypothetical protein
VAFFYHRDLPSRKSRRDYLGALVLLATLPTPRRWRAQLAYGESMLRHDDQTYWTLTMVTTLSWLGDRLREERW